MIAAPTVHLADPDDPVWTVEHRPVVDAFQLMVREINRRTRPCVNHARPFGRAEYWNRHDTTQTTTDNSMSTEQFFQELSHDDQVLVLQAARVGLNHPDVRDEMDLGNQEAKSLAIQISAHLNPEFHQS